MKVGADRKRVYILGGLVVIGGYLFYTNVLSTPSSPEPARPQRAISHTTPQSMDDSFSPSVGSVQRRAASLRASEEFRPSLKQKRGEDRIDPLTIDPTLRRDLLAKVQAVNMEGGSRNLFTFSTPPPPPLPKDEPKITPGKVANAAPAANTPPPPPPAPTAPPIPLKYYGYSSAHGDERKRAFFLDGDEILVAGEGETLKKSRYRVVHIGVNSVEMEDTQFKQTQKLPLEEGGATG